MECLRKEGIETQVHYIPAHLQPYYRKTFGYALGNYPVAESYYKAALTLPLHNSLTKIDARRIVKEVFKLA